MLLLHGLTSSDAFNIPGRLKKTQIIKFQREDGRRVIHKEAGGDLAGIPSDPRLVPEAARARPGECAVFSFIANFNGTFYILAFTDFASA